MLPAPNKSLAPGDALLIVDVQPDFCPGGALPIAQGDAVIPVLNTWLAEARKLALPVYASRDWHPRGHMSFAERGGPWPPHCIQDTKGARFHPALDLPPDAIVVTKGVRFDQDQNSAFDQTGLAMELKRAGVKRLWVGGLAEDVCVLASVLDARKAGFSTHLIPEGARPVTVEGGAKARAAMRAAGAVLV